MQPKAQSPDKITQPKTKEKEAVIYFRFTRDRPFLIPLRRNF